jgi:ABC-type sugar transport system ATPase subunit
MKQRVAGLLKELDAHVTDADAIVGSLSGVQRQAVAICRALNLQARLLIMDEPTAALAVAETGKLLALTRRLAERGCAVLLISHNIADVMDVADRVAVFRRGRKIAERSREAANAEEIIALITGAHPDVRALEKAPVGQVCTSHHGRKNKFTLRKKISLAAAILAFAGPALAEEMKSVAFVREIVGIPYFSAMQNGGNTAAKDLGVKFIYSGPVDTNPVDQLQIV